MTLFPATSRGLSSLPSPLPSGAISHTTWQTLIRPIKRRAADRQQSLFVGLHNFHQFWILLCWTWLNVSLPLKRCVDKHCAVIQCCLGLPSASPADQPKLAPSSRARWWHCACLPNPLLPLPLHGSDTPVGVCVSPFATISIPHRIPGSGSGGRNRTDRQLSDGRTSGGKHYLTPHYHHRRRYRQSGFLSTVPIG